MSDRIRRHAPRYVAPVALRRDIESILSAERRRFSWRRLARGAPFGSGFWRGAFSGVGVSAMAAGLAVMVLSPPSPATLTDAVTTAHIRALTTGRAIAVASSDHHTVKPWFSGRIALSPPVADFADRGFKLTGGRLDRVAGAPAAVVVYSHGKHEIDLFVCADRGGTLPPPGTRHGYHALFWKTADLDFAAVSDTDQGTLAEFSALVRSLPG